VQGALRPGDSPHALPAALRLTGRPGRVQADYSKRLAEELGTERPNARILAFKNKVGARSAIAVSPRPARQPFD